MSLLVPCKWLRAWPPVRDRETRRSKLSVKDSGPDTVAPYAQSADYETITLGVG